MLLLLVAVAVAPVVGVGGPFSASSVAARQPTPEDRYALAGGCYAVRSVATGGYVVRSASGFGIDSTDRGGAEPFHFQATDLGRYLLFGTRQDFLAADAGLVGTVVDAVTGSDAGGIAGGATGGLTDAVADAVKESPLGSGTGRGAAIVAAPSASELADWEIVQVSADSFTIQLPATGQALIAGEGGLLLASSDDDERGRFGFELTEECAQFPEIEINIDGPVATGATSFAEARGFIDAHLHMMAFEFLGGRVRCGRPWHPYGVAHALVDCPDHEPGGHGAVLEAFLSGGNPVEGHDTAGWPTFGYWPRYNSLTHEQIYYKWLERAWRGGLRMFVNLLADNHALCSLYPLKVNSCNEMDGVRLQAKRIRELERYIDAQSGGPGEGWFRIVTDPFQARRVINEGKLAGVLGIEISILLDCGLTLDVPHCTEDQIDTRLDEVYNLGIRQMELVNQFDNALSGVTGAGGTTGVIVNGGNRLETGRYWQMETCTAEDGESTDNSQMNLHDETDGQLGQVTERDALVGAILQVSGRTGAVPLYGPSPHCNVRGLSPLGAHLIRGMIARGMIFDPDHMSARARRQAMDLIREEQYPGVVSSHSWSDITIYPRVFEQGGVVTPYAGGSKTFVERWRAYRNFADPRYPFGFGYGSDVNGFGSQGGPRTDAVEKVVYPFTGFGGVTVHQQRSGEQVYDINVDGVAHYGLYPDWIEDLRVQAGDAIVEDMARGAEVYLQMWERASGIAPDACRDDVPDLTDESIAALHAGMTPDEVLRAIGQPASRHGTQFVYCVGARTATVTFTSDGNLVRVATA